ncbi:hypothetical protein [Halorhabdus salina]|uniref:hypothetical protein n=1 Tax=Halorhabdus salina TaxID=2750670 RepID=UPI001C664685|nr:hypothetical protein [Halorhabdus salina]
MDDDSAESTEMPFPDHDDSSPTPQTVTVPESLLLRVDTDRPPIWLDGSDGESDGRPTAIDPDNWRDFIVDDSARADRVTVSDRVDSGQVESFSQRQTLQLRRSTSI